VLIFGVPGSTWLYRVFFVAREILGLQKFWRPEDLINFNRSKANGPRTSLDDGQLLRATNVTTLSF